jgi:hypothetical protein
VSIVILISLVQNGTPFSPPYGLSDGQQLDTLPPLINYTPPSQAHLLAATLLAFATIRNARVCNTWVGELYVCLRVLNLGEQERAWITRDEHQGLGDAGYGGEV